ncbi:MAG: hypothetical protein IJT91_07585 [Clostridia bacterium]|nr:hypothetical protein [Clostridia bacterium]
MKGERFIDRISSAAVIAAIGLCVSPFVFFIAAYTTVFSPIPFSLTVSYAGLTAGYFLQAAAAFVFRRRKVYRTADEFTRGKFYDRSLTILPRFVYLIIAFGSAKLYDRYVQTIAADAYDRFSATPYLVGLTVFAALVIGGVIWFYPPSIVLGKEKLIVYAVIFFVGTVAVAAVSYGASAFPAICMFVFVIIYLLFSAQNSLTEAFTQSGMSRSSGNARIYNFCVSLLTVAIFALIVFVSVGMFAALAKWLTYLFKLLTRQIVYSEEERALIDITKLDRTIDPGSFDTEDLKAPVISAIVLYALRILIAVLVIVGLFFIFTRKDIYKKIFAFISFALSQIYEFFRNLFFSFGRGKKNGLPEAKIIMTTSYYDIETPIELSDRIYGIKTYNDYQILSDRLSSEKEKFLFAYAVIVAYIRKGKYNISRSDTPRIINSKLANSDIVSEADLDIMGVTLNYETIEYACREVDGEKLAVMRSNMEISIKRLIFSANEE